jgi:hypothetical protein
MAQAHDITHSVFNPFQSYPYPTVWGEGKKAYFFHQTITPTYPTQSITVPFVHVYAQKLRTMPECGSQMVVPDQCPKH